MSYDYADLYFIKGSFFFIPIICIILNYFLYRFKNKRINLFSLYSLNMLIFYVIFGFIEVNYYIFPKCFGDAFGDEHGIGSLFIGFDLISIIDLIITTKYFKEDKKKYKISFIITLIFISLMIISFIASFLTIFIDYDFKTLLAILSDFISFSALFVYIGKVIFQTIFLIFLIYRLFKRKNI